MRHIRGLAAVLAILLTLNCSGESSPTAPSLPVPAPTATPPPSPPPPSSGSYRGTVGLDRIQFTSCDQNGFFYRCVGVVRLTFNPAIAAGFPLIVNLNESSVNNGFYDRGPHTAHSGGTLLEIRIGGDISYLPWCRPGVVNVIDGRTNLGLTNGIPIRWDSGSGC